MSPAVQHRVNIAALTQFGNPEDQFLGLSECSIGTLSQWNKNPHPPEKRRINLFSARRKQPEPRYPNRRLRRRRAVARALLPPAALATSPRSRATGRRLSADADVPRLCESALRSSPLRMLQSSRSKAFARPRRKSPGTAHPELSKPPGKRLLIGRRIRHRHYEAETRP